MTVYTGSSSAGRQFVEAEMCFSPGRPQFEWDENFTTYSSCFDFLRSRQRNSESLAELITMKSNCNAFLCWLKAPMSVCCKCENDRELYRALLEA